MNVWLGIPRSANSDSTCSVTIDLNQFSETTPLTERNGKKLVYQTHAVYGRVSFSENCDYEAKQIHLRSFKNLNDECPTRGTCAPHNDQCSYASLYCRPEFETLEETDANGDVTTRNILIYNCYKADGTQFKNCTESYTQNKKYTRCDSTTYNAETKATDYSCLIHHPSVNKKHPLLITACTQYENGADGETQNQGCPLKKSCIDAMKANPGTQLDSSECPLHKKYYKTYKASDSPFTFDTSEAYKQPINSQLQQYVSYETENGVFKFTMLPEIWKEERGPMKMYFHVFAGSVTNGPAYFQNLVKLNFEATSKPVKIVPVLTLTSHPSHYIMQPFNQDL